MLVVDFSYYASVASSVFVFIIEKSAKLVSLHMPLFHSSILLLNYLLQFIARKGRFVGPHAKLVIA